MLNGAGGRVVYGVTPGGKIAGQDISDPTLQEVAQEIRRLKPPAHIEQVRVPVGAGKEILILETTTAPDAPYTYDGRPFERIGTDDLPDAPVRVSPATAGPEPCRAPLGEPGRGGILRSTTWTRRRSTGPCRRPSSAAGSRARRPVPWTPWIGFNCRLDGQLLRAAVDPLRSQVHALLPAVHRPSGPVQGDGQVRVPRPSAIAWPCVPDPRRSRCTSSCGISPSRATSSQGNWNGKTCRFTRRWLSAKPWSMRSATGITRSPGEHRAIFDDRLEVTSSGLLPPGITVSRAQAGPCLPPPQPADRGRLLPSRADRAMGSRHPENRRLVRGCRPAGARVRGASG